MKFLRSCFAALALSALPWIAAADGVLGDANDINSGGGGGDLKTTILNIAQQILKFVSLVAVVVIIIDVIARKPPGSVRSFALTYVFFRFQLQSQGTGSPPLIQSLKA